MLGLEEHTGPAILDADNGAVISFEELVEAGRHHVEPLGPTKTVLFSFCENAAGSAVAYAGALISGHAIALLDAGTQPALKAAVLSGYRPPWISGPPGTADQLAGNGIPVESVVSASGHEMIRTAYPDIERLHPDLALLLSTSGTTGSTKFVRLSKRNLESNAFAIADYLGLTVLERPITSLPMHYTFGLSVINSHWAVGAPVVLTRDSLMQPGFWDTFRMNECTSLAGVPFSYQMLERIGFREMTLPSLTTMTQAGGALDRRLQAEYGRYMSDRDGRFFVMYGQTEATARISFVPPDRLEEKIGSAGIPIPGGRISVSGPDGPTISPGVVGEIIYEGPNVMMGYAEGPGDLTSGDVLGGVLRTGDIGRLDDDGYLYLSGRSKRIAKVYGLRVNLDEVEQRIREHGPAAVLGDNDGIQVFCAFGDDSTLDRLKRELAKEFKIYPAAIALVRVEQIPTTSSDKIDYGRLRGKNGP